jgi:hypothetical protein
MTMAGKEIHLELLIGRRVIGVSGKPIGRLREIVAEPNWKEVLVCSAGRSCSFSRRVLDLSDSDRPQLTCPEGDFEKLDL